MLRARPTIACCTRMAMYAASRNSEPCAMLTVRIRPKINVKPDAGHEQQPGEGDGVERRHDELPRVRRHRPGRGGVREEHHPQRQCDERGGSAEGRRTTHARPAVTRGRGHLLAAGCRGHRTTEPVSALAEPVGSSCDSSGGFRSNASIVTRHRQYFAVMHSMPRTWYCAGRAGWDSKRVRRRRSRGGRPGRRSPGRPGCGRAGARSTRRWRSTRSPR